MSSYAEIVKALPYAYPFLFVDKILNMDEERCDGTYVFKKDLPFYQGHFKENPVTPGVILTECCAQIGLVCLGLFLCRGEDPRNMEKMMVALTSTEMEFLKPVFPGERVRVHSEKVYFRFNKLKCKVAMFNEKDELICKGLIAGMLKTGSNE